LSNSQLTVLFVQSRYQQIVKTSNTVADIKRLHYL